MQSIKISLPGHRVRQKKMKSGQENASEILAHYILETMLDYYDSLTDHWKILTFNISKTINKNISILIVFKNEITDAM